MENKNTDKDIKILCIDGGGCKGIIPAVLLNYIEEKTGKPIYQMFDLIAGTSTGGIITLLLTRPNSDGTNYFSTKDVIDMYTGQDIKTIFSPYILKLFHTEKYPAKNIESVLIRRFENTLVEEALTNILIPFYDTESRQAVFIDKDFKNTKMSDVARATSAAPTFFSPYQFNVFSCFDGGLFANNPSLCAYVEAKKLYPDSRITLVSLGTGSLTQPISYKNLVKFNLIQLIPNMIECIFDGINDVIEYVLKYILIPDCYHRFQIKLPKDNLAMDNVSDKNIQTLIDLTNNYIENIWAKELDALCLKLNKEN